MRITYDPEADALYIQLREVALGQAESRDRAAASWLTTAPMESWWASRFWTLAWPWGRTGIR